MNDMFLTVLVSYADDFLEGLNPSQVIARRQCRYALARPVRP